MDWQPARVADTATAMALTKRVNASELMALPLNDDIVLKKVQEKMSGDSRKQGGRGQLLRIFVLTATGFRTGLSSFAGWQRPHWASRCRVNSTRQLFL